MTIYETNSGAFTAEVVREEGDVIQMRRLDNGRKYWATRNELAAFYRQRSQDGEPEQSREAKGKS